MIDIVIAILSVVGHQAGIILNSIAIIILAWWLRKTNGRITDLEHALRMKHWVEAVNNGESPSDLAYMLEKGYLK